jgi:hypothetical protein
MFRGRLRDCCPLAASLEQIQRDFDGSFRRSFLLSGSSGWTVDEKNFEYSSWPANVNDGTLSQASLPVVTALISSSSL